MAMSFTESKFTIFDIKDFYPSIKETLFKGAIQFAAKHLRHQQKPFWSMASYTKVFIIPFKPTLGEKRVIFLTLWWQAATVFKFVNRNIHVTITVQNHNSNNIGLHSDDWSSVFKNISGQQTKKHKKKLK